MKLNREEVAFWQDVYKIVLAEYLQRKDIQAHTAAAGFADEAITQRRARGVARDMDNM